MNRYEKIKLKLHNENVVDIFACKVLSVFGYSNKRIETIEKRYKTYKYIKKKYPVKIMSGGTLSSGEEFKTIWICWLQGEKNAPNIVKKCIDSVRRIENERDVIVVDSQNFNKYIEIPEYIVRKWKDGKISNAHFSDILRTALMVEHGGIWMDATVYLTDKIPSLYFERNLFLFSHMMPDDMTIRFNSWFIVSCKGEKHMVSLLDVLYRYWKNENKVREYFLWHLIATEVFEKYGDAWEIYTIPDRIPELLSFNMNNRYVESYWNEIMRLTPIHKLSHKYLCTNDPNTFFNDIL